MTKLRAATFATLALLAIPALAHPADKERPAAAAQDGTCSAEQLAQVDAAFEEAGAALNVAIRRLAEEPNLPELRRWFGPTPAKFVRLNLQRVAERVAQGRPSATACNLQSACVNGNRENYAYAMSGTGALGVCRPFFRAGARGQDSRFGIIVHEMSHIAIHTRDATYQPADVLALAKEEPATASMNADSYEYLVEALYR